MHALPRWFGAMALVLTAGLVFCAACSSPTLDHLQHTVLTSSSLSQNEYVTSGLNMEAEKFKADSTSLPPLPSIHYW